MQIQRIHYHRQRGWSAPFEIEDSRETFVLLFGASDFHDDASAIVELRRRYPQAVLAGCSTSGEVDGDVVRDGSLVVALVRFERTRLTRVEASCPEDDDSLALGKALAKQLDADGLRGVLVLCDGLCVNGTDLVRGVVEQLPESVVVSGGLAGDGDRFQRTWVLDGEGRPSVRRAVAVAFHGDAVRIRCGSRGGWDAFGPERIVTSSSRNVLYELDGRPALDLYKEYLGERAAGLPATGLLFPLAIRTDEGRTERLVRTILSVDESKRSMTFAGDVPQGCRAQLMKANFERLIDGASQAAQMARGDDENVLTTLAVAVSCVGRRLVLGERAEEEVEVALEALPGSELIGFYSYGEISPSADGRCDLHNQTMTLTTISED